MPQNQSKIENELKETKAGMRSLQDSHQTLQLALMEKLGEINTHLSNLSIQFKSETEAAKDYRSETNNEIKAIKADISAIQSKQLEFKMIADGYKGIKPLLFKSMIMIISILLAAITTLAAIGKGLI